MRRLDGERRRLDALLDAGLPGDGPAGPPAAVGPTALEAFDGGAPAAGPGTRIADFRLVRRLGRGGMGEVWEAEELGAERRVALKLIRQDRLSPQAVARFEREARACGRLSHPGLVELLGAGSEDGVHWIAQQLVPGETTLLDFIQRARALPQLPEDYYTRVAEMVAAIAEALQVAHDAGVIHRDLKPQNVMLTPQGRPLVTDFGLARVSGELELSHTGDLVGTYLYMSPEQALARRIGIDHRSDVFSLGAVLYELLTLTRPFDGSTSHQVVEQIVYHDPPSPSELRWGVPRGLALVCGKALEKQRGRRYGTMRAFADDLRRFLANEGVAARPASAWRRAGKWARRHPTASALLGASAAALAVITTLYLDILRTNDELAAARDTAQTNATRAGAESDRARAAEASAKERSGQLARVASFHSGLLESADPEALGRAILAEAREHIDDAARRAGARDAEALLGAFDSAVRWVNPADLGRSALDRGLLSRATASLGTQLRDQPRVEAMLRGSLGRTYLRIGAVELAEPELVRALALMVAGAATAPAEIAQLRQELANVYVFQTRFDEAARELEASIETARALDPEVRSLLLHGLLVLGSTRTLQGRYAEAEPLLLEALEGSREEYGDEDRETLSILVQLGQLHANQGRVPAAEASLREALEGYRWTLGDDARDTVDCLADLAEVVALAGRAQEAASLYREALDRSRRLIGDDHPNTLTRLRGLADVLLGLGRYEEAAPLVREAVDGSLRIHGESSVGTQLALRSLAQLHAAAGEADEAERLLRGVIEQLEALLGPRHPRTLVATSDLVNLLLHSYRGEEAEPLAELLLESARAALGTQHPFTRIVMVRTARVRATTRRLDEAEQLFREAIEASRGPAGEGVPETARTISVLASFYLDRGRYSDAEPLLDECLALQRSELGDTHADTIGTLARLARLYSMTGRPAEAERACDEAIAALPQGGGDGLLRLKILRTLATVYGRTERAGAAEEVYREILSGSREPPGARPWTPVVLSDFATLLIGEGRLEEANEILREAFDDCLTLFSADHEITQVIRGKLGDLLTRQGRLAEAEPLLEEARERLLHYRGDRHRTNLVAADMLARLRAAQGRYEEAEELNERAMTGWRDLLGNDSYEYTSSVAQLADLHRGREQWSRARPLYLEARNGFRRLFGAEDGRVLEMDRRLAETEERLGLTDDAP